MIAFACVGLTGSGVVVHVRGVDFLRSDMFLDLIYTWYSVLARVTHVTAEAGFAQFCASEQTI